MTAGDSAPSRDEGLPALEGSVTIAPARPGDVPALLAMIGKLAAFNGDVSRASAAGLDRDLFGADAVAAALIADYGGETVGYAIAYPVYRAHFGERGLDLHHLFVEEAFRGQGAGVALLDAAIAIARARGCNFVTIGTQADNLRAQRFYEGRGLRRIPYSGVRFILELGERL